DFLIVTRLSARLMEERRQKSVGGGRREALAFLVAEPKLVRRREVIELGLKSGEVIEFDDPGAVGRIGEFQPKDFRVTLCLLDAVTGRSLIGFRLDDGQGDFASIAEQVVGIPFLEPARFAAWHDNPAIGEGSLFAVKVLVAVPAG